MRGHGERGHAAGEMSHHAGGAVLDGHALGVGRRHHLVGRVGRRPHGVDGRPDEAALDRPEPEVHAVAAEDGVTEEQGGVPVDVGRRAQDADRVAAGREDDPAGRARRESRRGACPGGGLAREHGQAAGFELRRELAVGGAAAGEAADARHGERVHDGRVGRGSGVGLAEDELLDDAGRGGHGPVELHRGGLRARRPELVLQRRHVLYGRGETGAAERERVAVGHGADDVVGAVHGHVDRAAAHAGGDAADVCRSPGRSTRT